MISWDFMVISWDFIMILMEFYNDFMGYEWDVASGKLRVCYGKSPVFGYVGWDKSW